MAREKIISAESTGPEDEQFNATLRPTRLDECIGMGSCWRSCGSPSPPPAQRGEPMEHVLLHGPPGLGKTTLAYVIAHEMGSHIKVTSGPALTRPGDLIGILTNLEPRDVLFIDEIHRLAAAVEEYIYPAMEEYKVDFVVDSGMHSRTINLPLKPFTLIGATTRAGLLSPPLRTRFGITHHLDFWPVGGPAGAAADVGGDAEGRRRRRRRWSCSPAGPAARRGSPTACSAAAATTPRSRATGG